MKSKEAQMSFIFTCEAEARDAYRKAHTMAAVYGRVTLADINEIIGNRICYYDTKIYWTAARFDMDVKVYPKENGEWVMHISDYLSDVSYVTAAETEDDVDDTHSIYINVTTADMDDPDCLICSVLTHAQKIRDRDIFINVY